MARARRIQTPGLIRHVMARGNGRMTIFLDEFDYRQFMRLFRAIVEDFELECLNYCLMPNHYHATLRPTLPNLSSAMQQLNSQYAQYWNQRHEKVGHVFQGPFKAQIVQRDGYALALSRYVALNPVRAKLVGRAEEWPWSSYAAIVGVAPAPLFLSVDSTLALFGDADQQILRKRFADFVCARSNDESTLDRIRSSERILGDGPFKSWVRREPVVLAESSALSVS